MKRYRAGEDVLKSPPFRLITTAPMTEYSGGLGRRVLKISDSHGWILRVYTTFSKKVSAACSAPKDRLETYVNEGPGILDPEEPSDMVARTRRKVFHWGSAVSFLSQTTQDGVLFAPHNGHLAYEIWGVTPDRRYTVVASVSVSHPRLADWGAGPLRVARSMKALKGDRDYKRIETCTPEEFTPSLAAFDQMLDSLTIR